MKKAMNNFRILAIVLVSVLTLGAAQTVLANDKHEGPAAELKFIGNLKDHPVFQLNLNNAAEGEYIISIKDNFGNLLYSEKIKGDHISRKYSLNPEDIDLSDIRFEVTNRKSNETVSYKVSRNTRYVQDVTVSEEK
jgi:hypothetical protein